MKLKQFLIAIDQLLNTVAGGYADETISARAYRCRHSSKFWSRIRVTIDVIFFWQDQHCFGSFVSERVRTHLPIEYRIAFTESENAKQESVQNAR